jgi:glycopeptide antibiotics resistance protein
VSDEKNYNSGMCYQGFYQVGLYDIDDVMECITGGLF